MATREQITRRAQYQNWKNDPILEKVEWSDGGQKKMVKEIRKSVRVQMRDRQDETKKRNGWMETYASVGMRAFCS